MATDRFLLATETQRLREIHSLCVSVSLWLMIIQAMLELGDVAATILLGADPCLAKMSMMAKLI